jgi:hypothetical protein
MNFREECFPKDDSTNLDVTTTAVDYRLTTPFDAC